MAQQIQIRRGTAAAWTAANPTLANGELGAETDTGKLKLGNGATAWNALAYLGGTGSAAWGGITGSLSSQGDLTAALAAKLDAAAHAADTNPHPVYLTQAEGDALYAALAALNESIDDRVAALLVAGANITLTYNDPAGTLTIAAAGGAGATNLTVTLSAAQVVVNSDTGTDATIPPVDATNAGVVTPTQKATWDAKADAPASVALNAATNLVRGTHGNRLIICNSASPFTLTIEDDTTGAWQDSDAILVVNIGAGLVTLAGDGTSAIVAAAGYKTTIPQNTVGGAVRSGANAWKATTPDVKAAPTGAIVGTTDTQTLSAKQVLLAALEGADDTWEGIGITGRNAGATIAQWDAVYLDASGTWQLADANGTGTYPCRGLAVAAYSSGNAAVVVDHGTVRNDAWAWTPGGDIYLSTTAGGLTQTAPSASGDKVQKVGYALSADSMRVQIGSGEYLTIT